MCDTVFISFLDSINKNTAEKLIAACNKAINDHSPKNIYILLSSSGGNISYAFVLFSFLKSLPVNITTHAIGNIDSCAINLFLAGEIRYATKWTTFMFHETVRSFGKDVSLNRQQMKFELSSLEEDQKRVVSNIIEFSTITPSDLDKLIYLGATVSSDFAMQNGLVHEVKDLSIPQGSPIIQIQHLYHRGHEEDSKPKNQ